MTIHTLVQPWDGHFGTKTDGKHVTFRKYESESEIINAISDDTVARLRTSGYWAWIAGCSAVSRYILAVTLGKDLNILKFMVRVSDHATNRPGFDFAVHVAGPYASAKADVTVEVLLNSWRETDGGIQFLKIPVTDQGKSFHVPQDKVHSELLVDDARRKEAEDRILTAAQEAIGVGRINPLSWDQIELKFPPGQRVNGSIIAAADVGFIVDLGCVYAFLPRTQLDVRPAQDAGPLMGRELTFEVVKLDKHRETVVVSRRAILEEHF